MSKIVKPGELFFLTEKGLANSLTVQAETATNTFYEKGFFHGFHRKPTTKDPFLLLSDYQHFTINMAPSPDQYFSNVRVNMVPIYMFAVLFVKQTTTFAVWLDPKKKENLEDMIVVPKIRRPYVSPGA